MYSIYSMTLRKGAAASDIRAIAYQDTNVRVVVTPGETYGEVKTDCTGTWVRVDYMDNVAIVREVQTQLKGAL